MFPQLFQGSSPAIIIIKRSMAAGYGGVENRLFYHPRTQMLFGGAKKTIARPVAEVKGL